MTLIAFATYPDRAELITDTAAYTAYLRHVGHRSKVLPLPHVDAALATQGDHRFGVAARVELGEMDVDFDSISTLASARFRQAWGSIVDLPRRASTEGSAFLVGYSVAVSRFVAYQYLAEHDFEREEVAGVHIMPTPLGFRPQAFEVARLNDSGDPEMAEFSAEWLEEAEADQPTSRDEWRDLALLARRTRALHPDPRMKVVVAGKLLWTRVARGRIRTEVIHEFDDTGEELDQLIINTLHPRAQIAPCGCGSGARALDCHIAASADAECPCGSEKTFRECCMITPEEAEAALTMGLVAPRIK